MRVIILLSVMIYRPFCKYLCPLGAFYAPLNKISVLQLNVNKNKCVSSCPLDALGFSIKNKFKKGKGEV